MNHTAIVWRETGISIAINAVISLVFFVVVFGLRGPVPLAALGPDFLPQAFMIALMGSLVPGLLVRRYGMASKAQVVRRAVLLALSAVVIAGGGAWIICRMQAATAIGYGSALALKTLFGAVLAAVITPIAVRSALSAPKGI